MDTRLLIGLTAGGLAVAAALGLAVPVARAQTRNCPKVADQLVIVRPGQPAAIHLDVTNLGAAGVSVFQNPLGGALYPTGPEALDFVFIPDADFSGYTTMTYRVEPPAGCGLAPLLATVTLAGGDANATLELQGQIGVAPAICGTGMSAASLCAVAGLFMATARRRVQQRFRQRMPRD